MSHEVETMAWTGQKPWHGLGFEVKDDLTPAQMLKAAKLDWTVSKRPLQFLDDKGNPVDVSSEMALVRDSDNSFLTVVGTKWKPIQNEQTLEFFSDFVHAGDMKMETAGSLLNGQYVWALARVGKEFAVKLKGKSTKDNLRSHLLFMSPHRFGNAAVMQYTATRVVCWNTLNAALGSGLKGDNTAVRIPHTLEFTKGGTMIILVAKKKTLFSYKVIDDNTVAVTGKVGGKRQTRKQKFKVTKDEFEWANPLDGQFDGSEKYKRIK